MVQIQPFSDFFMSVPLYGQYSDTGMIYNLRYLKSGVF